MANDPIKTLPENSKCVPTVGELLIDILDDMESPSQDIQTLLEHIGYRNFILLIKGKIQLTEEMIAGLVKIAPNVSKEYWITIQEHCTAAQENLDAMIASSHRCPICGSLPTLILTEDPVYVEFACGYIDCETIPDPICCTPEYIELLKHRISYLTERVEDLENTLSKF